jgi:hypothetical protein
MKLQKNLIVFAVVFIVITATIILLNNFLNTYKVNTSVLHTSNFICFLLNVGAFYLQQVSLKSKNPKAFVMAAMGTITAKLLIAMVFALVYIVLAKAAVNKPAVVISLFFYLIYMVVEVFFIFKIITTNKNA